MKKQSERIQEFRESLLHKLLLEEAADDCLLQALPDLARAVDAAMRGGATPRQIRLSALRAGATPESMTLLAVEAQIHRTGKELGYDLDGLWEERVDLSQPPQPPPGLN